MLELNCHYLSVLSRLEAFCWSCSGTTVTVGVGEDGLQTLSSDGATLAMQQVMMGGHSEEDDDDEDDEEDEEDEDNDPSHSDMTRLGLETSDSL